MSKRVKRLFEQFQPENYNLSLDLDPDKLKFSGKVTIAGQKTGRPSQRITFHQKDLKVTAANIVHHGKKESKEIPLSRINSHKSYDEVRLHADEMIYPGQYTVTLEFSGKITDSMVGIYPCYFNSPQDQDFPGEDAMQGADEKQTESYQKSTAKGVSQSATKQSASSASRVSGSDRKQAGTVRKVMLATQFESHHAREAFPCIDEPEAKASFDLELITPLGQTVLSNTPIKKQTKGKKLKTVFETSPIMSSYLLAFVAGEIHCVSAKSKNGIEINTWGHAGQPQKFLQYANDEAVRVIDFFEDYFDTPFPLKKCDQVALPDFESGAMENWGLITYREVALLTDPDNRSVSSEQYVSMVIAHELSHQWFGNLVTMKWWDDLWLNESFASLMEHVALDRLHPDWNQWENYASADIIACSNRDIYKDVQPVRVEVKHPDEIHTLFDPAIVYAKGGRLLKMLIEFIGEDTFRKGLKLYFEKHRYKNTTRDDLWEALSEASGVDVNAFMNPWLEQSGMPILKVNSKENELTIEQERFVLDADDDKSLWPIPLLADRKLDKDLLAKQKDKVKFDGDLPLLNAKGSGHYLVSYEAKKAQDNLARAIEKREIPAEARINVINDMLLMVRRGDKSIVDVLSLIEKLSDEPRDAVWAVIARSVGQASVLAEFNEPLETKIKKFKVGLASDWHSKLGWEGSAKEDPNTTLLRTTAIGFMIGGEDKGVIGHALKLYKSLPIDKLPAEERGIILGAAVRHDGSNKVIDELVKTYKNTPNPDLQLSIASALTHTKDTKVAKNLIKDGLQKGGFVRNQDVFRWFAYLMRNRYTRELAWKWLVGSWTRLEEEFGKSKSLDHFVVYSAGPLHTEDWQKKFIDFWGPKQEQVVLARNIKVALSEIEARVAWHNRDLPQLKAYFDKVSDR